MILAKKDNMYKADVNFNEHLLNTLDLHNRLFLTFTTENEIDRLIQDITRKYTIIYRQVFVLSIQDSPEYVCTYNIQEGNIHDIPQNTILVHRKKDSNTLYTINALNNLIESLNGGVLDKKFPISWQDYKNSILLTNEGELKQLSTKIYKVIKL